MSEQDFNKLFAKRLKYYLDKYDMTQKELAHKLGVGTTIVSDWVHARKTPRMDKIDAMCEIFHYKRVDLISDNQQDYYYIDPETRKIAEEIKNDPNQKILFKAARTLSPDDMKLLLQMVDRLKGDEEDE
jgi:transcriptional regulator with XRE-family HTH domain